jgi:prepilin-type N-terminal cleavage/methylation domain-containing protein/prepilin-type processing-associated H-X9-DG protein
MVHVKNPQTGLGAKYLAPRFTWGSGFSLVELLVVIAIIALLLSILTPSLMRAKSIAVRIRCSYNLRQIHLAMNLYTNANDNAYPCAQDPLPTGHWLWMGRGWRSFIRPYLDDNIDPNNPSVLFCPQDRVSKEKYESTSYGYSMAFYHSSNQIDQMNSSSDTYGSVSPPCIAQRISDVANPSGKILIGDWLSNHQPIDDDKGWWCWQGRRNYLFADGQVYSLYADQIRPARDGLPDANLTIHGIEGVDYNP